MSEPLDQYITDAAPRHLEELFELLRIPSISADSAYRAECRRCAASLHLKLESLGFEVTNYETGTASAPGHPIVLAERIEDPALPTVLIYGHYDVQPPDPVEQWTSPPFEPQVRDGKIYARGATDDKGQMFAHVLALESLIACYGKLPVNVRMLIEGEEEVGSAHLRTFLEEQTDALSADVVMISDSPMFGPGRPAITLSLRGLSYVEVTVCGASHDLHSGLFGGAAPNPIHALASMVTTLHDASGAVAIDGFYDGVEPLSEVEREELAALGFDEAAWLKGLEVPSAIGEAGYTILERVSVRPTVDCNGLWGGYIGEGAKTVIPAKAHAKISCRLVPNQEPERIASLLKAHLERVVPAGYSVETTLHHGASAFRADRTNPAMKAALGALEDVWGVPAVLTRGGGSIPVVADFHEVLGLDSILMGLGLEDDRLHSPDEKFDVENFHQGIRASARFLQRLAALAVSAG